MRTGFQQPSAVQVSDTASTSTVKSTPTAADLVAQAAAAAAAATLADSPGKPARRPALQLRGVRDALSKAGIKTNSNMEEDEDDEEDMVESVWFGIERPGLMRRSKWIIRNERNERNEKCKQRVARNDFCAVVAFES